MQHMRDKKPYYNTRCRLCYEKMLSDDPDFIHRQPYHSKCAVIQHEINTAVKAYPKEGEYVIFMARPFKSDLDGDRNQGSGIGVTQGVFVDGVEVENEEGLTHKEHFVYAGTRRYLDLDNCDANKDYEDMGQAYADEIEIDLSIAREFAERRGQGFHFDAYLMSRLELANIPVKAELMIDFAPRMEKASRS